MKIWHISDTHCYHHMLRIPEVDMVVHSGDATTSWNIEANKRETVSFLEWFSNLPIEHKIYVPGNHDRTMGDPGELKHVPTNVTCLINQSVEIGGISFYGFPYTRTYGRFAFMREEQVLANMLADVTPPQVFITHGPPAGYLDKTRFDGSVGSTALRDWLNASQDVRLVLCGHIHNEPGIQNTGVCEMLSRKTLISNAAMVSHHGGQFYAGNIIDTEDDFICKSLEWL